MCILLKISIAGLNSRAGFATGSETETVNLKITTDFNVKPHLHSVTSFNEHFNRIYN